MIFYIYAFLDEKQGLGAFSEKTARNRQYELLRFQKFCETNNIQHITEISRKHVICYLKSVNASKSSKVHVINILNSFFNYLVSEGHISENPAQAIQKPKAYPPKTDYLNQDEIQRIYAAESQCGSKKSIERNLLLFSLFIDVCLRVSETVHLTLKDVRLDTGEIWVVRKREKVERLPLSCHLVERFHRWYDERKAYKGANQEWVFLSSHGKQLKPRQVYNIVSKALERAGIVKRKQGPHLLRHSGASLKAQAGENLIMIQHLLGHENLNTTRRYLHFDWEDLKRMVERGPQF